MCGSSVDAPGGGAGRPRGAAAAARPAGRGTGTGLWPARGTLVPGMYSGIRYVMEVTMSSSYMREKL